MVDIVGVRFKPVGKIYYFDPGELLIERGANVIVETARGVEYGKVEISNRVVEYNDAYMPLKKVVRVATPEDDERDAQNRLKEKDAFEICLVKIARHGLEMKLVDVEFTFDMNKVIFYFTADGRVDFRELVKDLACVFRTRIELRQIGVRDEAKLLNGLGVCGNTLCCATFLSDFQPVSIKMAKEQNLSLKPAKISGLCGRLMCCLKYEEESYKELNAATPQIGDIVKTPDGSGEVLSRNVLRQLVKVAVHINQKDDVENKFYYARDVETIKRKRRTPEEEEESLSPEELRELRELRRKD
jgi:cell fate regulator YaaT (PSP1 superfamily)